MAPVGTEQVRWAVDHKRRSEIAPMCPSLLNFAVNFKIFTKSFLDCTLIVLVLFWIYFQFYRLFS